MWFRRRRKVALKPFDESALPQREPLTLEEATDEGLMLADYANRMTVKNRIEVAVLNGNDSYAVEHYVGEAREAIEALAQESEAAADRIAEERRWSESLVGDAEHVHDYRSADRANLEFRLAAAVALADKLRERARDDGYVESLVERARGDAWREISAAIEGVLDRRNIPVDAQYKRERTERMRRLVTEDLEALLIAPRQ
ncbi:MAG TPA: hypothetical protein VN045_01950 [Microbacteriaceae bacterium]|nr:hypothetical protein [Microbacteriaceae bacterium]